MRTWNDHSDIKKYDKHAILGASKSSWIDKDDDQVLITEDVITISVADFNAVSEIVLPPDAASAQPYEFAEASAE